MAKKKIKTEDMPAKVLMGKVPQMEWVWVEFRNPETGEVIGKEIMQRVAGSCQSIGSMDRLLRTLSSDAKKRYEGCSVYEPEPSK